VGIKPWQKSGKSLYFISIECFFCGKIWKDHLEIISEKLTIAIAMFDSSVKKLGSACRPGSNAESANWRPFDPNPFFVLKQFKLLVKHVPSGYLT